MIHTFNYYYAKEKIYYTYKKYIQAYYLHDNDVDVCWEGLYKLKRGKGRK